MTTTTDTRTVRDALNESTPGAVESAMQKVLMGDAIALLPISTAGTVTSDVLTLPTAKKAKQILSCYATAGTTKGYKTVVKTDSTPGAGEVAINQTGNIAFAAADAVTAAEVTYIAMEGEVITETLPVSAVTITFSQSRRAQCIISATGNVAGALVVDDRGTAGPAAGHIAVQDGGTTAKLNAGATDTAVTVVYVMFPGIGTAPGLTNSLDERLDLPYSYGAPGA